VFAVVLAAALLGACRGGPKRTCKVNDQCFVCPDEAAITRCKADPTRSRCKWTPPEDCK
jgi:hypothetical protein